ncbi:AGAP003656-PA-like protein [Anopheles sinensis]|uniref:AGAP003656-PA-like protein n=1 Tax=Anopheles sinensis TaxID=74873 RepID=A0A084VTP3_ANOSI|nr:AGAP003656-PA-like protein [Anopheles sinensis]
MTLLHFRSIDILPNVPNNYSVPILEEYWQNYYDNNTITREELLTALANVTDIFIRATYYTASEEAAISYISMDIAREATANASGTRAWPVEHCQCPQGHKGLSCEDCESGFFKGEQGLCQPCACNGRSEECNPLTGVCLNCQNNTYGPNCERYNHLYIYKPQFTVETSSEITRDLNLTKLDLVPPTEFGVGDTEANMLNRVKANKSEVRSEDTCHLLAEVGECQNYTSRWYYDNKEQRCRHFYYGGCGGNGNNFADNQSCASRCADDGVNGREEPVSAKSVQPETPPPKQPSGQFEHSHSQLPMDNPKRQHVQDGLEDIEGSGGYSGDGPDDLPDRTDVTYKMNITFAQPYKSIELDFTKFAEVQQLVKQLVDDALLVNARVVLDDLDAYPGNDQLTLVQAELTDVSKEFSAGFIKEQIRKRLGVGGTLLRPDGLEVKLDDGILDEEGDEDYATDNSAESVTDLVPPKPTFQDSPRPPVHEPAQTPEPDRSGGPTNLCRGDDKIPCGQTSVFICEVQRCDGRRDCPNGEDETPEACGTLQMHALLGCNTKK